MGAVLSGVAGWLLASWSSDQDAMDEKMADKNKAGHVVGIDEQTYKTEQNDLNSRVNLGVATTAIGVAALGAGAWMLLTAPDDVALAPLPAAGGKGIAFLVRF